MSPILHQTDIEYTVKGLKEQLQPDGRFASFDYCYNYFRQTDDLTADLEKSCLVLGYFLASWGMLRGGSYLSAKSIYHYKPVIEYLNELKEPKNENNGIWKIDIDNYTDDNIQIILKVYDGIKENLLLEGNADRTVVTKVMLGVFGCVPAFDMNFIEALSNFADNRKLFNQVDKNSLGFIQKFYLANKTNIDCLSNYFTTTDFVSGRKTKTNYPKVKIIDMYGFAVGRNKINLEKENKNKKNKQ